MNVRHLTDHSIAGYAGDRRRIGAPLERRAAALLPVIKATGWMLAGAGVGSLTLIALLWALTSFTTLRLRYSDPWTVVNIDQHPLAR
jgi:hypothetical protein